MFTGAAFADGIPPDSSDSVDMHNPEALLDLVRRLDAGETLTVEEMEGIKNMLL